MSNPAFPTHTVYQDCGPTGNSGPFLTEVIQHGMTQRQYYKAKALAGLMANPSVVGVDPGGWAELCGRVADAMLAEDAKCADELTTVRERME